MSLTSKYRQKFSISTFLFFIMCLQCFADESSVLEPAGAKSSETLLSLLIKGGPVMIPLLICSIVCLDYNYRKIYQFKKKSTLAGWLFP